MTVAMRVSPQGALNQWRSVSECPALDFLCSTPDRIASLIILDPPDNLSYFSSHFNGQLDATPLDELLAELTPLAAECKRVLLDGGSTVLLGSPTMSAAWEMAAAWAGMRKTAEITVLWDAPGRGKAARRVNPSPSAASYASTIRRHTRPGLRVASATLLDLPSNVLICREVPLDERRLPSQRPIELFTYLINTMTEPRSLVLDPFCGSGSALVAAELLDRYWSGCDIDSEAVTTAQWRIARAQVGHEDMYTQPMYWWLSGDQRIPVEG